MSKATPTIDLTCNHMCNNITTLNNNVFVGKLTTSTPAPKLSREQRLVKARELQARYQRRVVTIELPKLPEPRPKKIKIEFLY